LSPQDAAARKAAQRARDKREKGLERLELKAHPEDHEAIKRYAARLAKRRDRGNQ